MKQISRELKADLPNLGQVRTGATPIAELAPQVPSCFPPGTGPDVGKTEARAEIWQSRRISQPRPPMTPGTMGRLVICGAAALLLVIGMLAWAPR